MTAIACYVMRGVLTTETALHVGLGSRTGVIKKGRMYIPGSYIRGGFGAGLLRLGEEGLRLYGALFGEEEEAGSSSILFRHAYPLHLSCGGTYFPARKTLFRCTNLQCRKVYNTFAPPYACEVCSSPLIQVAGFECQKCGEVNERPLELRRITMTAINRDRGSYAEISADERAGTLHVLETVGKGAKFEFLAVLDGSLTEAELNTARLALERCIPDEGIGGSKTRGLGKVRVGDTVVEAIGTENLERRAEEIQTDTFAVDLLSPMILDSFSESTLLEACRRAYSWCFHRGKPLLPEVRMMAKRQSFEMLGGWSLRSGGRRGVRPAISAGSSFLFSSRMERDETLAQSLAALEYSAIGAYKPHGNGWVRISHGR